MVREDIYLIEIGSFGMKKGQNLIVEGRPQIVLENSQEGKSLSLFKETEKMMSPLIEEKREEERKNLHPKMT